MTGLQVIPLFLCVACAAVALYALGYNWVAFVRARRGTGGGSPILFVGPLFAFIAGGMAVKAGLPLAPAFLWVPPLVALAVDPAGLPLLIKLVRK
jgi:hypothetical protein